MKFGPRNEHSLAVRYQPMAGESIKSFLMRLADVNACSYRDLLSFLDMNFRNKPSFTPGSPSEQQVYSSLARALNVSQAALLEVLRTPELKDLWVPNVKGTSEMKIRAIRLCTSCLSEARYHRQAWQHAMYCVCPKHKEQLIDACPDCGTSLELETCLGGRCSHCSSAVTGWEALNVEVPTWQLLVLQGSESRELLVALLKMAMIAVRPTDLFPSDIRVREMRVGEVLVLMQKAWGLLHSYTAREALRDVLQRRWYKESQVLGEALPMTLYREATKLALDIGTIVTVDLESPVFESEFRLLEIIKSTKRFALTCKSESVGVLVKGSQLISHLGIKPSGFEQLKLSGVFTQVNPSAAKKDALFSLEDAAIQVGKLTIVDIIDEGYVAYEELVPTACKFISGLNEGRVLVDIFKHGFPALLLSNQEGTILEKLYVKRDVFFEKYQECDVYTHKTVPITYLPSFFGTKMPNIQVLLKTDFIQGIINFDAMNGENAIPTYYLKYIHDNYLILNKWSFSHNKSKTKCLCALKLAKIEPLVKVSEKDCNSFEIYPRCAEQILLDRYDELTPNYTGKKKRRKK